MTERKTLVRTVALLAGFGFILVALAATTPSNLLRNGGFEAPASDHGGPDGWSATRVPGTKEFVALDWDDKVSHTGSRSVSIAIHKSHPDNQIDYNWNQAVLKFEPGKTYDLTAWIKAQDLKSTASIVVQCWDSAFTKMLGFASTQKEYQVIGSTGWVQVKTTISMPDDTGRVMILAVIRAPDNRGGRVWFDDIQITPATDSHKEEKE
jgi:hypothetical protein